MSSLVVLLVAPALAQAPLVNHPAVPSAGIAAENGPGTLWVNPANLSYDPDLRYGLFFDRAAGAGRSDLGATIGKGALNFGVHNALRDVEGTTLSDWSLDYATSIGLPERLSLGLLLSWDFIDHGANYVAYDAGLSWRPLPWLGFGGVAQNVGNPDPNNLAIPKTGGGIALRPFERFLVLGVDYSRLFLPQNEIAPEGYHPNIGTVTARIRPVEGLYFRGNLQAVSNDDGKWALDSGGLGIEAYFGGRGVGIHQTIESARNWDPLATDVPAGAAGAPGTEVFVGTDEPGESLVRSGRSIPVLDLDHAPKDHADAGLFGGGAQPTWLDTLELLRRAVTDRSVRGMVISLGNPGLSWAQADELRARIAALEAAGKPVLVYLTGSAGNVSYYVATSASEIAMHPAGDLELVGLSSEMMYLRGLLDWVGVEPQFVRDAEYKSAVEQYTRTEPSPPSLEQADALLDDTFHALVTGIAGGRNKTPEEVQKWIDDGPWTAEAAKSAGLVDDLLYPDEVQKKLEALHGGGVTLPDLAHTPQPHSPWEDPSQIAVIYVDGAIVGGPSSPGGLFSGAVTGSDTTVAALRQAGHDDQIRAIVLRIDSPGGSSFASDEIWRAVDQVRESGKPVVVSMGGVAASGGYYVASGADAIWAEPTTITGSIGVFSGKMVVNGVLDRLGIDVTTLSRGRNATVQSATEPWDDTQRAKMQEMVDETYGQFKGKVSDGRHLTPEEVEAIARGRVWSGQRAAENGLVDHLGGFEDAIADARTRGGINPRRNVSIVTYSESGTLLETLAPSLIHAFSSPIARARSEELARAQQLLAPAGPALIWAINPEEHLWLMNPWTMEIGPR
jgi:protease-4